VSAWPLVAALLAVCAGGVLAAALLPRRTAAALVAWFGAPAGLLFVAIGAAGLAQAPQTAELWALPPLGSLAVRLDPLAGFFLLVTGLVVLPVSLYAVSGLKRLAARYDPRGYAVMYFALLAAVAWILLSDDAFSFLVSWEIMSLLVYLLVTYEHERDTTRRAAYLMLGISEAGALAAALGLLLLAARAGSLQFSDMRGSAGVLAGGVRTAVFLLTFFGFGVKAGLVPVNVWLPAAYTSAPAAFVPLLAGATLNLGLYGIVRVNADLAPPVSVTPGLLAVVVGTASALVGILYATTDNDLKTLLAHSSIENAGIITAGLGAGFVFAAADRPALAAMAFLVGLYHLLNHALYKTLLFVGVGGVDDGARTRDLDRLGGLIRRMPWTALAMLAGVLSIAALPPFNGFVSEWLTLQTFLRSAELPSVGARIVFALCGAGLALTAALAVTCFVKLFAMGFLGVPRTREAADARESPRSTLAPMALLAALCLLLGVLPTYVIPALDRAVAPLAHSSATAALVPPFFTGSPGHDSLPAPFVAEFHDLGAQVGQRLLPGPGLVLMHRGGNANPVVFAGSPAYLLPVLAGLLALTFLVARLPARRRTLARRIAWDGGIRHLLPEMTYTATGFSNPVRVIFQALFRPTIAEDTPDTVAEHFRTAIVRETASVHLLERLVLVPAAATAFALARLLARIHHGLLNAYVAYALGALLVMLVVARVL